MTPDERQQQLVNALSLIDDRQERLAVLVEQARQVPRLPEQERSEINRVPGCASRVWLLGSFDNGRCRFRFDADSPLVKGLVKVLCDTYNDATPAEVVATEPAALAQLGLLQTLSPTRRHGLEAVRRRMVELARIYLAETEAQGPARRPRHDV